MVQITVAGIEFPKEGKKQGRVIDSTGKAWGVWADKLGNFQQFQTYEITYKSSDFRGKTYYTIETAVVVGGNGMQQSAPRPPQPGPPLGQAQSYSDNERRMDIFICGAFNNIMANPTVEPIALTTEGLIAVISRLKQAWKMTLGPQAQQTAAKPAAVDPEMNDEIPF